MAVVHSSSPSLEGQMHQFSSTAAKVRYKWQMDFSIDQPQDGFDSCGDFSHTSMPLDPADPKRTISQEPPSGEAYWMLKDFILDFVSGGPTDLSTQGPPSILPWLPPNREIAEMIYDDYLQNYRRYEHWQATKRQESCRAKLQETAKGLFATTRKPAKDSIECLEDTCTQPITVVDTANNIVQSPEPFPEHAVICWTLQGEPAQVLKCPEGYKVDTDLILASGQELSCQVLVHNTEDIHHRLSALWTPFWNRHQDVPPDRWQEIVDFACSNIPKGTIEMPPLTLMDWHKAVAKFKTSSATGPRGWSRADLLNLTDPQIQDLLDFYGLIERRACWPKQWTAGLIHCIKKRDQCKVASDFRPITLTSMFHRLYTGIRAGQILASLTSIAASHQCGFVQGKHSADIWAFVGVCIEVACQQDTEIFGWVADLEKCFNTLARQPIFAFLLHLGVPDWFIRVWNAFLTDFTRYFVVHGATSPPHTGVTGFPEGCPLSCCAMAAVDVVWHAWQTASVPRSLLLSYVDNLEAVCVSLDDLDSSVGSLRSFCAALDVRLDEQGFFVWSSTLSGRRELRNKGYNISLSARDLGGQVVYCKQLRNKVATDRIKRVHEYFGKLRNSGLAVTAKLFNILQVLWPRALYGSEAVVIGSTHLHQLRSGAMKSARWDRAGASPFVRIGPMNTEHDPEWYQLKKVLKLFRRLCSTNLVAKDWWKIYRHEGTETFGPFGKLMKLLEQFGIVLDESFKLWYSDHGFVHILDAPWDLIERIFRRRFHLHMADMVCSRQGYTDLVGCDVDLTTQADHKFPPAEQEQLMIVRDGSFFSGNYKSKFDARHTGFCPWCNMEDTRLHRYTECSRYDHIRSKHAQLFQSWESYPVSFQLHGLVPANPWQELVWEALTALPCRQTCFAFPPTGNVLNIFTDGACSNPANKAESLAAWAVIAANMGTVSCGHLCGPLQCIMRAEIVAVLSALHWIEHFTGDVHIWIDNEVVVGHLRDLQAGHCGQSFAHPDLWAEVTSALNKLVATLHVHKVASHVGEATSESPLEDFCFYWNEQADLQADVTNQQRPEFFREVWERHLNFRRCWTQRVNQLTAFQLEIAQIDCEKESRQEDSDNEVEVSPIDFVRHDSSAFLSVQTRAFLDSGGNFGPQHDNQFRELVLRLAAWLISQDTLSSTMRVVSIPELYVGFRKYGSGGAFVSVGVGASCYQAVTFAAEIAYFRKAVKHILSGSALSFSADKVDLRAVKIHVPQVGIQIGWPVELEQNVIEDLRLFVGHRPIQNAQGWSKPWTP